MRALKHDWTSIASFLPGRSVSSVNLRFYTGLNLANVDQKYKKVTTEDFATIRDMLDRGFYLHAIAKKIGRSYHSTRSYIRRIRAEQRPSRPTLDSNTTGTKHPKRWTRAETDRLLCLHAAGLKPTAVARELGRSLQAVQEKYKCHIPHRMQNSPFVAECSGGDSVATLRPRARRTWSKEDEEHLAELVANGTDLGRIATVFNRTVGAVTRRWKVIRLRLNYERKHGISSHASSEEKQRQQTANKVSQIDPQSRRNFTTMHAREPRLAINLQEKSSALTYSSHRVVRAAPWKRRGVFSLPYRPQQRFEHTKSTPSSQTERVRRYTPFSEEETLKIVELRAAQYPWIRIAEIVGRSISSLSQKVERSLKEQRWREKFEEVRTAMPDDQKYYGARKDFNRRPPRRDKYSVEEQESIVASRARGRSWEDIAEALGRSMYSVRNMGISLWKDERWLRRFEEVRSTVPDVERLSHHKGPPRFTQKEDAMILDMRKAGSTFKLIAEAMGRPTASVINRWHRYLDDRNPVGQPSLGQANHSFTAEDDRQLKHMLTLGMTYKEMALAIGVVSSGSIHWRLKRLRAPAGTRTHEPWSDAEKQKLRAAVAEFQRPGDIEQLFPNRTAHSLRNMCMRLKLPTAGLFPQADLQSWTAPQDAELLRLVGDAGETFTAIGAIMGKDPRACESRYGRLREISGQ